MLLFHVQQNVQQNVQITHTMYFIQSSDIIQKSEFYIIIFLNRLKIVENTPKNGKIKIKCLWLRLSGPFEIQMPLLDTPGPGPMYLLNLPLIGPAHSCTPLNTLYWKQSSLMKHSSWFTSVFLPSFMLITNGMFWVQVAHLTTFRLHSI